MPREEIIRLPEKSTYTDGKISQWVKKPVRQRCCVKSTTFPRVYFANDAGRDVCASATEIANIRLYYSLSTAERMVSDA